MATPSKDKDRRAERTHQMLRQAFLDVVREKGLTKTSVQDIVDRANVSRGTFYAHFEDKYALIETIVREEFQHSLNTLPHSETWSRQTLTQLVQIVLEYFKSIYQRHHRSRDIGPVIDKAVREELAALLLSWLKLIPPSDNQSPMPIDMAAHIISWTIFGAALQWSQDVHPMPVHQMADAVVDMLMDGMISLPPEA